jgi:hypothetical protein
LQYQVKRPAFFVINSTPLSKKNSDLSAKHLVFEEFARINNCSDKHPLQKVIKVSLAGYAPTVSTIEKFMFFYSRFLLP